MLLGGDDRRAGEAAVISGGESSDDDDDEGTPTAKVLTVTITAAGEYREHAMAAEELILARFPEPALCMLASGHNVELV
eukprot:m.46992 g.46992  ORF g.46992 m.46992 type:complete len:79 (+) comp15541_c0_seq1:287-523(+)